MFVDGCPGRTTSAAPRGPTPVRRRGQRPASAGRQRLPRGQLRHGPTETDRLCRRFRAAGRRRPPNGGPGNDYLNDTRGDSDSVYGGSDDDFIGDAYDTAYGNDDLAAAPAMTRPGGRPRQRPRPGRRTTIWIYGGEGNDSLGNGCAGPRTPASNNDTASPVRAGRRVHPGN